MSDLLKEAIADAKAVRETALENAKIALQEAFAPQLKSMLSAKLAEDDDEYEEDPMSADDEEMGDDEEMDAEKMARSHSSYREEDDEMEPEMGEPEPEMGMGDEEGEEEFEQEGVIEINGKLYAPVVSEDDEFSEEYGDTDEGEELDLEAVIRELEQEIAESEKDDEDKDKDITEVDDDKDDEKDESVNEQDDDKDDKDKEMEEQSSSSGIGKGDNQVTSASASDEEDPGKGQVHEQVEYLQSELKEYKEAVTFLRDKLHEVNILNAKLLYTNKLFKEYALTNEQKLKVVETFDRAQTTREIKLVWSTLAESMKNDMVDVKSHSVQEAASRKTGSTKPTSRKIITEESEVAARFKKLAGILKD